MLTSNYDADVASMGAQLREDIVERTRSDNKPTIFIEKFRKFRNIIDFATNPEGLALTTLWEYNRQYQYIRDFYSLLCPHCNAPGPNPLMPYDAWGKSPSQLQEEILFEIDYDTDEYSCPKCGLKKEEARVPQYNELIGVAGMRSGKTVLSAVICAYELHCDLLLENPQKSWGLIPGQEIYYTVCTTQGEQAKDTIFAAIDGLISNSPWFIRYISAIRRQAQECKVPIDTLFTKTLTSIRFLHKQLFIDLTGTNSAGIAGKTRKVVVMDEIARFIHTESRMGVDAVYDTLKASLLTLSKFGSKMLCISSPWVEGDKIMTLLKEARKNQFSNTLTFWHPTWDFNPSLPRDHPMIEAEFKKNPIAAKRDYGADPPAARDPWISEPERINECIDPNAVSILHTRDFTKSFTLAGKFSEYVSKEIVFKDFVQTKHIVIACDPGLTRDSFGMLLCYLKPVRTVFGVEEHMFVGANLAWVPTLKPKREVDFANVLECIQEMAKHWIVDKVIYDQWNSVVHIQELMAKGIEAEKVRLVDEDWDHLAGLVYNHQIHFLSEAAGGSMAKRLIWELHHLGRKENGKIDHGPTTSSDLAVCLARAAKILLGEETGRLRAWDKYSKGFGKVVSFKRP